MLRKQSLILPVAALLVFCTLGLAQNEKKKESGYVVRVTDSMIMLSKTPLGNMSFTQKQGAESEGGGSEGEAGEKKTHVIKRSKKPTASSTSSGAQAASAGSKTFSFSFSSIQLNDDTETPEKEIKKGDKVTVYFRTDGDTKIATKIEFMKEKKSK